VILPQARGNHAALTEFLKNVPSRELGRAIDLLKAVSEKDRRDIAPEVLADHFATPRPEGVAASMYNDFILNPRVADEMLTPYKAFFRTAIPLADREAYNAAPERWVTWVADSIAVDNRWNPRRVAMSPAAVWRMRTADSRSRDIFFVAAARAMGIPARIDAVTEKPQYARSDGSWADAIFSPASAGGATATMAPQGMVVADFTPTGRIENPAYYYNFTISRLENGVPVLLNYPEDATWAGMLKNPMPLDAGNYMLTTGQRMADGTVLSRSRFFAVNKGETTRIPLEIRQDTTGVQVIGSFNSENLYHDTALDTDKSILSTTGRGYYVIALVAPNHEPTVHVLNDLSLRREELEQAGTKVLLLFADADAAARFDRSRFPGLPSTVVFGTDIDGRIAAELASALRITPDGSAPDSRAFPVIVVADTFNRVVFNTNGYTIGVADRLTDTLHRITNP
ncbi:MAG: transglutaminase-like domain-containing protein, partial [Muribaculaceae bacterium]|nr:transglutaminase-like domain-containing protein [Muribaculaceae bacterium]